MSDAGLSLYRLVLRCYPKDFRRDYGTQMIQLFLDRRCHSRASTTQILTREVSDAAITAAAMRWEKPMTKVVWIAVAMAVTIAAAVVGGPLTFAPLIAAVAVVGFVAMRRARANRPIDQARRWWAWTAAGALAIAPGVAILATSDDELSELLWSLMALSIMAGLVLLVVGVSLAVSRPGSALPKHV